MTVEEYISNLPEERKAIIVALRNVVLENLPQGFVEEINYGMLGYVVPHSLYPKGYHATPKLPLPFMNIASQKSHIAVYHMNVAEGEVADWFRAAWAKHSSKKLDIGKSCIRFKKAEDVPIALIGELAAKLTPQQWIEIYENEVLGQKKG